jgi:TrmH family RNA methyltransferase
MLVKSQVKYIQSLSQKKERDEERVFIAEGPKIINELLQAPNVSPKQLFAVKDWVALHTVKAGVQMTEVSQSELERISTLQAPNQVLGIFTRPVFGDIRLQQKVSLMLDTIQDPGNMGTIIRCADWFGIDLIICSPECADVFNSKVVQSTMGSISRVQVIYEDLLSFMQEHTDIPVFATALDGIDINSQPTLKEGIILMGNESKGISPVLLAHCKERITIPRKGKAESLNAAVATGIILSKLT